MNNFYIIKLESIALTLIQNDEDQGELYQIDEISRNIFYQQNSTIPR